MKGVTDEAARLDTGPTKFNARVCVITVCIPSQHTFSVVMGFLAS